MISDFMGFTVTELVEIRSKLQRGDELHWLREYCALKGKVGLVGIERDRAVAENVELMTQLNMANFKIAELEKAKC